MNQPAEHPSRQQLLDYSQGRLTAEDEGQIEEHLTACDSCCETLDTLPEDTLEQMLRMDPAATTADSRAAIPTGDVPSQFVDHPRYLLRERIGVGGMGAVYRAEHRKMQREVALKVINPEMTRKAAAVERFEREVRAAAQLEHENIVTAHDADHVGDLHFLVLEYVEGQNLAELMDRQGALPIHEACHYARQVAAGLEHAHQKGMVHRDIKPHNLMLSKDGKIKILDFGLANWVNEQALSHDESDSEPDGDHLTRQGALLGSLDYVAPEQADDPHAADIRADIYALGATLYFLLAGRPPFAEAEGMNKLQGHKYWQPRDLNELRVDMPAELADVIRRMMAKDPEQRFQTPAEVADALAPFVDRHRSVPPVREPAPPVKPLVTQAPPPAPTAQRRPTPQQVNVTVVAACVIAAAFVLVLFFANRVSLRREHAARAVAEAMRDSATVDSGSPYLLQRPEAGRIGLEPRRLEGYFGVPASITSAEQTGLTAITTSAGAVYAWPHVVENNRNVVAVASHISLTLGSDKIRWGQLTADGSRLITCGKSGSLRFWKIAADKGISRDDSRDNWELGVVEQFALSPDGKYAATIHRQDARVWDLSKPSELEAVRVLRAEKLQSIGWIEDGARLVTLDSLGQIQQWETPELKPKNLATIVGARRMSVGPRGMMAIVKAGNNVEIRDSGGNVFGATRPSGEVTEVVFSPSELLLYIGSSEGLTIIDARRNDIVGMINDRTAFYHLGIGEEGELISAGEAHGGPALLWRGLERAALR